MRKLHKNINHKLIVIAVVLLLFISIGYAALSTTLTINGTANIDSNSWLVYFTNVQVTDGSKTPVTAPSTNGTSTTSLTWEVNLDTPGDFYEYYVDVKNDGTIDAMIGSLSNTSLTANQAKYLRYSVTYFDGAEIEQYDKLEVGDTATLKVRVEYRTDINPEDLPNAPSVVELTYSSNYVQADGNAKDRNRNGIPVGYAVQIYGINEDVDSNGDTLGLTFGPATGDNYNNKYVTHRYEETSAGSGVYNIIIETHTVASDGSETTSLEYLYKNGETIDKVTRTEAEKNKYDINMHEMTWGEIAKVSDKTAFLDCMLCGDTKKVELYLNDTIGTETTCNQYGDGAGTLAWKIRYYFKMWNPAYNSSDSSRNNLAVGRGLTFETFELMNGSNARNAGGYSTSHLRTTLIGQNLKTNIGYAGDINLSEVNSLYSCLPSELKKVITSKKIRYVTGNSYTNGDYSLNDDLADKIWAFSEREVHGTGEYTGTTTEGLGNDGHSYGKFISVDSKFYISSYNNDVANQRVCYDESDRKMYWCLRSPYLVRSYGVGYVCSRGEVDYISPYNIYTGVNFGFCIK